MEQLSALDNVFLYLDTPNAPMHVGMLAVYDQSTAPEGGLRFKDIIRYFEERLHHAKVFRRRKVDVPLSLDRPYWIEDPDFDIEFHLRHIALPSPGDWRQLCILASRIYARPLDLSRPPWEAYVIEGLDNMPGLPKGSFALLCKIHHSAIDGVGGAEIMAAIHDLTSTCQSVPPRHRWVAEREPTAIELLARTSVNRLKLPLTWGKVLSRNSLPMLRTVFDVWDHRQQRKQQQHGEASTTGHIPRTRFNGVVSPHRVFEGVMLNMEDIRTVQQVMDEKVTVNDIVVSVVGGALRKYLKSKHELPHDSLNCMVPINVRSDDKPKSGGNVLNWMFIPIRTDVEKPVERLREVKSAAKSGKQTSRGLGKNFAMDMAQLLPTTASGLISRTASKFHLADYVGPLFNTVITNVQGPETPLYHAGARMVASYGMGVVYDSVGLFHIVFSYNGFLTITVTACRKMMPDPAFYADCIRESFAELMEGLGVEPADASRHVACQQEKEKEAEPIDGLAFELETEPAVKKKPADIHRLKKQSKKKMLEAESDSDDADS